MWQVIQIRTEDKKKTYAHLGFLDTEYKAKHTIECIRPDGLLMVGKNFLRVELKNGTLIKYCWSKVKE